MTSEAKKGMREVATRADSKQAIAVIHLATTALEDAWPVEDPVTFLGTWCLRYSRREAWVSRDWRVMPYHWDDRDRIPGDVARLADFGERLLPVLADTLNRLHRTSLSLRAWRLIAGWWLSVYLQIMYDRWTALTAVAADADVIRLRTLPPGDPPLPSAGFGEFRRDSVTDWWNERLMGTLASRITSFECIRLETTEMQSSPAPAASVPSAPSQTLLRHRAASWLRRRPRIVSLHTTYLSRSDRWQLEFQLGQLPDVEMASRGVSATIREDMRSWKLPIEPHDEFEAAALDLLPQLIPISYIEGYADLSSRDRQDQRPSRPSVILTTNGFAEDEAWKVWAAHRIDDGSRLVIEQHGGHYGVGLWSSSLDHELAVADRYLSWGWRLPGQDKVVPAPAMRLLERWPPRSGQASACLLVTTTFPRYAYWAYAAPVAGQMSRCIDDQVAFATALGQSPREALAVRLAPGDYGWDVQDRWRDGCADVSFDDSSVPLSVSSSAARLCVVAYNATSHLELLARRRPTLMFWDPKLWEMTVEAAALHDRLRETGLLFDTPEECAEQVNRIWHDVDGWWAGEEVQAAVRDFCQEFAYVGNRPIRELAHVIRAER